MKKFLQFNLVRQRTTPHYCLMVSRPLRGRAGDWICQDDHETPLLIPIRIWEEMGGIILHPDDEPIPVRVSVNCVTSVRMRSPGEPEPPDTYKVAVYQSGTTNVELIHERGPWLTFYDRSDARRKKMASEIADFLNGKGDFPDWMWDMHRTSASVLKSGGGSTCINVTGPMIDSDPPKLAWVEDRSNAAIMARNNLMDKIDPNKVCVIG